MYKHITILLLFFIGSISNAQVVPYHHSNTELYGFIEEMATSGFLDYNTALKPFSRIQIAKLLHTISKEKLNRRQLKELEFYLKDFDKDLSSAKNENKRFDLFYYTDSTFKISFNPILGVETNIIKGKNYLTRTVGADMFSYIGKHVGIYANLRDNSSDYIFEHSQFLTNKPGAVYKLNKDSSADFSEMRGGVTLGWNWGYVAFVKDHFVWGNNYHGSNIFSGRTPSFAQIKIHLKPKEWLEFNYVHGSLVSQVTDSSSVYNYGTGKRYLYYNKYLAANILTVKPLKKLYVSIGNSIIYSDNTPKAAYLIPFFFYKSVDHSLTGAKGNNLGQNAQMFLDVSSRQLKNTHLFATIFVDEISISRMRNKLTHSNFVSLKIGVAVANLPIKNLSVRSEFTITNPIVYRHFIPTTTFESNNYNLGHYLGDNAQEIFASVLYKPFSRFNVEAFYVNALKGTSYGYTGNGSSGLGLPFMQNTIWSSDVYGITIRYQLLNDLHFAVTSSYSVIDGNPKYHPKFVSGQNWLFNSFVRWSF